MEKLFGYEKKSELMDKFFRDYLTYHNGRIPNQGKVYEEFQNYHTNSGLGTIDEFCTDLYESAVLYTNMVFGQSKYLHTIGNLTLTLDQRVMNLSPDRNLKVFSFLKKNNI
ncbi:MAG: hypothetical protein R3Y53_06260 [Bacillota bacterium]